MQVNTRILTKTSELLEVKDEIMSSQYLSVDTETTGLGRFAEVIGVSVSPSPNTGYYIPIKIYRADKGLIRPWSDEAYELLVNMLIEAFTKSKRLLTHNGVFDAKVIENTFGINIIPYIFADTQLLHHTVIDESPPHGLKPLAVAYLDPEADSPQDDLKESVIANGGRWTKHEKDFWKGDWKLLGRYGAYDTIYTYQLFNLWYPELLKSPKLVALWNEEVMPLMAVTYDLNTVGIKIDVDYFKRLEVEMADKAKSIEDEIFALISDKIKDYEFSKIKDSINITPRSEFGRFLKTNDLWPWEETPKHKEAMEFWYKNKNGGGRVFNLDSPDDKAFLLFDVLNLPVKGTTAKGKRSVTKAILDELADQYEDSSVVLKLMRERSKELKLLSTYVKAILETHDNGRIYPDFNQTGTTSGRYSSGGNSINMQTLPREDTRIKKGFIADEGRVFIASDYSALEPRTFADVSGEPKLIETMKQGLDFYSSIAINVLGLTGVSANPADKNYLGKVDKEKRQWVKAIALSIPYGASAGRLSQMMKIEFDEAKEVYDKYIKAFPVLKKWMDRCDLEMKMNGYVESAVGRRKRNAVVHELYNKYKLKDFSKYSIMRLLDRHGEVCGISDPVVLYLEARNALNVSKNHKVQSFAASVCNQAMIDIKNKAKEFGLDALVVLNVHDEIILNVAKNDAEMACKLLKECMTNNRLTRIMKVSLDATPIITDKNLAEAK